MFDQEEAMEFYEGEMEDQESGDFEFSDEYEAYDNTEIVYDETEEMEFASQLLEITEEAELDQFLGNLIKKAGRSIGQFARSDAGRALGGILKGAAKKALPVLGSAIGRHFGGATGARLGGKLASRAGSFFGLELEGLSQEDMEFEVARRFVRFSNAAARNLASTPRATRASNPRDAAKAAVIKAAKRHAPGLVRQTGRSRGCPTCGATGKLTGGGRWIRRGRNIIIINCQGTNNPQTEENNNAQISDN